MSRSPICLYVPQYFPATTAYIYIYPTVLHCLLFVHLPAQSVCMSHSTSCMSCSTICLYVSQYSLSLRLIFMSPGTVCQYNSQYSLSRYNYLYVSQHCLSVCLTVLLFATTICMSHSTVCLYVSLCCLFTRLTVLSVLLPSKNFFFI